MLKVRKDILNRRQLGYLGFSNMVVRCGAGKQSSALIRPLSLLVNLWPWTMNFPSDFQFPLLKSMWNMVTAWAVNLVYPFF